MTKIICFVFIVMSIPLGAWAHSGGTNAEGCHHNRKTGEYHCHNKKLKSPQIENSKISPESENQVGFSNEKPTGPRNKNRIYQWVDEQGEVHYSKEINDLPDTSKDPKNSE